MIKSLVAAAAAAVPVVVGTVSISTPPARPVCTSLSADEVDRSPAAVRL